MRIIFCEECGAKNIVSPEAIDIIDTQPLSCQVCSNLISRNTIISYSSSGNDVDTSMYRILFIDDDFGHLEMVSTLLKTEYDVSIAATGKRGLALAEKNNPDLILLDVNMPIMDGYQVCAALKDNKKTRHIPIIFVTAETESDEEYKGLSLGAVDYITKPFNFQILHARIALQLKTKLMQDDLDRKYQESSKLVASLKEKYLENEAKQETIQMAKENLEMILDSLEHIVIIQDSEKRITWANKTTRKLFKRTASEIIGKLCHEILQDSDTICDGCPLSGKHGTSFLIPLEKHSKSLKTYISISHLPLFDDSGELSGITHLVKEETASDFIKTFRRRKPKT